MQTEATVLIDQRAPKMKKGGDAPTCAPSPRPLCLYYYLELEQTYTAKKYLFTLIYNYISPCKASKPTMKNKQHGSTDIASMILEKLPAYQLINQLINLPETSTTTAGLGRFGWFKNFSYKMPSFDNPVCLYSACHRFRSQSNFHPVFMPSGRAMSSHGRFKFGKLGFFKQKHLA